MARRTAVQALENRFVVQLERAEVVRLRRVGRIVDGQDLGVEVVHLLCAPTIPVVIGEDYSPVLIGKSAGPICVDLGEIIVDECGFIPPLLYLPSLASCFRTSQERSK